MCGCFRRLQRIERRGGATRRPRESDGLVAEVNMHARHRRAGGGVQTSIRRAKLRLCVRTRIVCPEASIELQQTQYTLLGESAYNAEQR